MKLLLGRKLGMTQVYDESGRIQPVTVIQAGPCVVTQVKTHDSDGYAAIQIGFGTKKSLTKPLKGHLKKSKLDSVQTLIEVRFATDDEATAYEVGQTLDVGLFTPGETVAVSGTSKGKGYAGVIKRHGFAGGPASHGSDFHRAPGAIGGRWPQRVPKGRRMAGHMGASRVTIKGLTVVSISPDAGLVAVQGAIPGPRRSVVEIRGEA